MLIELAVGLIADRVICNAIRSKGLGFTGTLDCAIAEHSAHMCSGSGYGDNSHSGWGWVVAGGLPEMIRLSAA